MHDLQLILKGNVCRSVWRICMWILGLKALKRAFGQLHTLSRSFHLVQFVKCWQIFVQWNSKVQEKKKESLVTTSSPKRAIRQFHVVVGQGRRRGVRKSTCKVVTLPIQTYCFLLFFFLPFSLPSPVSFLNLPICFVSGRRVGNWPKSSGTSLS